MLNEYEEENLKVMLNASNESSRDVWEVFVNAEPEVLLTYAIKAFGLDKVKDTMETVLAEQEVPSGGQ